MGGLFTINIPTTNSLVVDGGLNYKPIRFIKEIASNNKCVLLVSEIDLISKETYRGIIGSLFELRGSSSFDLVAIKYDVIAVKSYASVKYESTKSDVKIGSCTYNGNTFIGIRLIGFSNRLVYFSGLYSGNCQFKIVEEDTIQWIE